jgi:hypothetical protein
VTLPPGRARLGTSPLVTGSDTPAKTTGMALVARCAARAWGVPEVTMTSTLSATSSAARAGIRLGLSLGGSVFNHDSAALDVAEVTQSLTEGLAQVGAIDLVGRQVADASDLGRLLRLGSEGRGEEAQSEDGDGCDTSEIHAATAVC